MVQTVAYQGVPASFSHIASLIYAGDDSRFVGTTRFREIFELVVSGKATVGVVPIENSLAGSVHENYDLLAKNQVFVVGEIYLPVQHNLMGIQVLGRSTQERINDLKRVYSHPKALEQCVNFFERNSHIEQNVFSDTAGAAKEVMERKDPSIGAIASRKAADLYGLEIFESNIEDDPNNLTRFVVIAKSPGSVENANKCSLIFKLPHVPRSLLSALTVFEECDLTKIESRPIHGQPFNYLFHLDFEYGKLPIGEIEDILKAASEKTVELRVLGRYRAAALP